MVSVDRSAVAKSREVRNERLVRRARSLIYHPAAISVTTSARQNGPYADLSPSRKQERTAHISTDLFLRWQERFGRAKSADVGETSGHGPPLCPVVARHRSEARGATPGVDPGRYRRARPYIYSDEEIPPYRRGLRRTAFDHWHSPLTYPTLFGLIAVTGLRVSEAISLDVADVDLETGVITLRHGKTREGPAASAR